jgi:DNA helicase HerA-like ATPase
MRKTLAILPLAAAVLLGGCLQKETSHTLYVTPDGAVAWMALETDVRSDAGNDAERRAEEQSYLASARSDTHGIARGLAALDPAGQQTRVLRAERPFVVVTEARFSRVDALFERMLADLRVPGYATLTRTGDAATLLIHIDVAAAMADESDRSTPVTDLIEEAARYRIVLTEGRFTAAQGFTLSDDGMTATPIEMSDEEASDLGGVVELSLTWGR